MEDEIGFPEFLKVWNQSQGLTTPAIHRRMAEWLAERWRMGDRRLLLMAFRNSGKSTVLGLFAAWLLATDPNRRILVLAADATLAGRLVRHTRRVIEQHELTATLRPATADQWAADRFTVARTLELRDPSMLARGITGNITGSHADVVVCDDVEVPNTADTPGKRQALRERLREMEYVLNPDGLQLYAGTPHSYYSIYADTVRAEEDAEEPFLAGFARLELPLLDEAGRSLWPERFTPEAVAAIRRKTGPNRFASQMLLLPMSPEEGRLDPEKLVPYEAELDYREANGMASLWLDGRRLVSASCWWDPAWGAPGRGDASVVAAVFSDGDGIRWLHRVRYLTHDPALAKRSATHRDSELGQMCREVAAFMRELHLPSIRIETNGVGKSFPGMLRDILQETGTPGTVIEETSSLPKARRILNAFDAILAAGRLRAHAGVWQTPFVAEMREWTPGARGRDDGLDAVSGCLNSEPWRLSAAVPAPRPERREWRPGAPPMVAATEFEV